MNLERLTQKELVNKCKSLQRENETLKSDQQNIRACKVIEHLPDAILIESTDRVILQVNQKFCELFDIDTPSSEFKNRDSHKAAKEASYLFEDSAGFIKRIDAILARGKPVYNEELELKDGRVFERDYVPFNVDNDQFEHIWHYRDITGRKRTEALIRKSEERFQNIFEATINVPVQGYDRNRRVIYWNPASEKTYGYSKQEALGKKLEDLIIPQAMQQTVVNGIERWLHEGIPVPPEEMLLKHKDGSDVPVYSSHVMITNTSGQKEIFCIDVDMSAIQQAEQQLADSEAKYRTLVEQSLQGMIIAQNNPLRITFASKPMEAIGGYSVEELETFTPEQLTELIHPEDRAEFLRNFERRLNGQDFSPIQEYRIIHKSGRSRWFELYSTKIDLQDGPAIQATFVDITRRKEAENALHESEERYRTLVEDSPLAIVVHGKGKILYINPAALKLIGARSAEDLLGQSVMDFVHSDYRDLAKERVHKIYNNETDAPPMEEKFVRLDGQAIDVEVTGRIIQYQGQPASQIIIQDITNRKETEQRYHHLIKYSGDAIYLLYNRRFEVINDKFTELFGMTLEDVSRADFDFMQLVAPKSRPMVEERIKKQRQKQNLDPKYEFTALNAKGEEIEVEAAVTYIQYKEGIATQGIIRDVTERKRLEARLRQAQKMEAVGQLAGGVAHDFNNLLTIINGYCDLLALKALPHEIKNPLNQIQNAGQRATRLTGQLLAFSRKQIMQPEFINLNELIANHLKMLGRLLGEDIEIATLLEPDLETIYADPGQVEQILMNITINARDAMPSGGKLTIKTEQVMFETDHPSDRPEIKSGQYVLLCIADNGIGMDEATSKRIFEPFFTTKSRDKGTGLGLATVYGIVKQNDGYIYVNSAPQKGTKVDIFIPAGQVQDNPKPRKKEKATALQGRETILLAEDDAGVRDFTQSILNNYGYTVLSAANGEEALRLYDQHGDKIDLLLTDVVMPLMNGKELADRLLQKNKTLKILFFSGYTNGAVPEEDLLQQGHGFIQKPYSHGQLAKKIRRILDEETE
ncbi:MAG: PAS domain S-box protein [Caldithrix sp.]|nr:PAS domain S-box protein [Caldithrix sp.]